MLAELDCSDETTTVAGRVKARRSQVQQVAEPRTPLRGHRLSIVRVVWIAVTVLALATFVASVPAAYAQFHNVCPDSGCAGEWRIQNDDVSALQDLGLSPSFYAAYNAGLNVVYTLAFFAVGTLIFLKKPDDWMALLTSLALISYGTNDPSVLAEAYPAWSLPVAFVNFIGGVGFFIFFYLFPNGRFVPRWTRALAAIWIVYLVPVYFFPTSPFSGSTWPPPLKALLWLGFLSTLLVAQVYRYVRVSGPVEREQTKWLVFGLTVVIAVVIGFSLVIVPFPMLAEPGVPGILYTLISRTVYYLALLLVPLSIAIAILRYRLWDIHIIINRTLVYSLLSTCVVGVYVLVVGAAGVLSQGSGNIFVSLLATGLVALIFHPLRVRLQRGVNRLMYGERDDPYAVLSRLGKRFETSIAPQAALPTIVETIAQALKLPYAAIEHKLGNDAFETVAEHGTPLRESVALPFVYHGEEIGRLVVAPRTPGESFTLSERKLLEDLARQAGSAVHDVRMREETLRLSADLQRSREQLVTAREEERRRLRRDLHDGVGPQLAALMLELETASDLISDNPEASALMAKLSERARETVSDVRRSAHALRPPALDELGLLGALRDGAVQYSRGSLHVSVEAPEELPPLPAAVEVACYRIAQEAMTNVVRHAQASNCWVRIALDQEAGVLRIEVEDDGKGIPEGSRLGVGMTSMRERAEELGGILTIEFPPQGGTLVNALLPCRTADGPESREE
jgi:signal transduction histidine kinase